MQFVSQVLVKLGGSTVWLFSPAVFLAVVVGLVVSGYDPLMFDAQAYQTAAATPALEKTSAEEAGGGQEAGTPAPASATKTAAAPVSGADFADGTFTGYAACGVGNADRWKPYYVAVTITVKDAQVASIDKIAGSSTGNGAALTWDAAENQKYLDWAISGRDAQAGVKSQLDSAIAAGKVPAGVDTVSGATYSSVAIYNAFADALAQSAAKAGKKAKAPKQAAAPASSSSSSKGKAGADTTLKVQEDVSDATMADGSWTAFVQCGPDPDKVWNPYYVGVTVVVKDGKAVSVDKVFGSSTGEDGDSKLKWDAAENQEYLDGAIAGVVAQIQKSLSAGKLPASVDTVSGATFSSKSIFEAFYAALKKSAAAGGATVEVPPEGVDAGDGGEPSEGEGPAGGEDPAGDEPGGEEPGASGEDAQDEEQSYYGYAYCNSSGSDSWDPYYLFVEVKVRDGVVTQVARAYGDAEGIVDAAVLYSASQNKVYLDWAVDGKFGGTGYRMKSVVKQIQAKLDAGADVEGIQTVSGATRSSKSILEAFKMAVDNAAAGIGDTPAHAVAGVGPDTDGEGGGADDMPSGEPGGDGSGGGEGLPGGPGDEGGDSGGSDDGAGAELDGTAGK